MEVAIGITADKSAWTVIVPWARAWHRATAVRQQPGLAAKTSWASVPKDCVPDPPSQDAWSAAESILSAARERRAEVGDPDSWPGLVAQHAVHLAIARVRLLAKQFDIVEGQLAGAGTRR
jgi:hypothetical protein